MSDLSLVLEQLKKNNQEESSRDTNINKNIAFSRKSNQESLEHIERAIIASNKETVDNNKNAASAEKEAEKEDNAKDEKNLTVLGRIGDGIFGLGKKVEDIGGGAVGGSFFKTAAMIGLLFLLPKVLNHPLVKKSVKFIEDTVIPKIKEFADFIKDKLGPDGVLIAGLFGVVAILKPGLILTPIKLAIQAVGVAFKVLSVFINKDVAKAILNLIKGTGGLIMKAVQALKVAFLAIRTFMIGTLIPAITATLTGIATAIAPLLLPAALILAAAVVLIGIFKSINDFFNEFNTTLEDTGSVGEAIKSAIARFFGSLLSFIPGLFIQLIGFVAKMFGFEKFAESLPSMGELSDIMTQGIMDAINFVSDIFSKAFEAIKNFGKKILQKLGLAKKEEDMTPEELNEQKTKDLLKEQKDETKRRTRLASKLSREQRRLTADRKRAEKQYEEGEITAEDLEGVRAMEKSGIKAMAENRFFLEKSRETEDALRADLKSENFRIARGEGEFGQGDMSGMTKTAALKAQEARIDKINDQMLEKYGFQTNQQGAPVIINNDASVRSNSSSYGVVNESITPRNGLLVSATADF